MDGSHNGRRTSAHRPASQAIGLATLMITALALTGCTLTDLFGVQPNGDDDGAPVNPEPTPTLATIEGDLLQIDSVDVLILESFPVQVNVVVRGTVPDACTQIGQVTQQRTDNQIEITVATTRDPNAFCAQVLTTVEETIAIPGDFPPGDYAVTVNGVTESFRV